MSRYINADEIVYSDVTDENRPSAGARITYKGQIDRIPTAIVAPVVHGHWIKIKHSRGNVYWNKKCSICGKIIELQNYNFCPNCGAKMDGQITEADAALDCAQHTSSGLLDD